MDLGDPDPAGQRLGIDAQFTAIPFFVAAVLGCAWWTASLLHGSGKLFDDRLPVFAAIGTVLLVVPAGDLGQREHLLVAAILPYLALFARSLDGERTGAARVADRRRAGGPRLRAQATLCRRVRRARGAGAAARPAARSAPSRSPPAATLLVYAGLVALFCPAYLRRAVPLALALYGATDVPLRHLLVDSLRLMFGQAVALLLWWNRRRRVPEGNLMLTLVVFAITSTAICFIDGKDWFYHRLPATIATVLALLCWVGFGAGAASRRNARRRPAGRARRRRLASCSWWRPFSAWSRRWRWRWSRSRTRWPSSSGSSASRRHAPTSPSRNGSRWAFRW